MVRISKKVRICKTVRMVRMIIMIRMVRIVGMARLVRISTSQRYMSQLLITRVDQALSKHVCITQKGWHTGGGFW